MYEYGPWDGFYWHMGALFNIVLLLFVILGAVYLIQSFSKGPMAGPPAEDPKKQDTAIDTLKKRYAAGEINAEEFSRKKKDLES